MEFATLNNGIRMPMAGIGTFLLTPDEAEASVKSALACGYRLIDTANAYVNEKAVGRAMKQSGLPREEIFLETKLWPSFYEQDDAVDKTLERLGTDYIDLLLIHQPAGNYVAGYRQMEKAYKAGKVKAIGLSNFTPAQIREILAICEVKPAVLQTEVHPYSQEKELKAFLDGEGIRSATAIRRCLRSRSLRSSAGSTARAARRSSCAGTSRTGTSSSRAPRTPTTSARTSTCSISP